MATFHTRLSGRCEPVGLAGRAYVEIRDCILKRQFSLGAALSRRKLAAGLGMSLLPVAEALQRLESDGLVESRPRIGTRLCIPSPQDIHERYEVREALESQAARLFAEKANVREKLDLQGMAEQLDAFFDRCASGEKARSSSSPSRATTSSFTSGLPSAPAAGRCGKPSRETTC
jgi:DNA-binding GntR family transcriptional regulator